MLGWSVRGLPSARSPRTYESPRLPFPRQSLRRHRARPATAKSDDVILRVTSTAICGSDLHIYNGFLPQKRPMTLGHEFMGIVEEIGSGVTKRITEHVGTAQARNS